MNSLTNDTKKLTRTGISLELELLERFDKVIKKKGYSNRSEAIRDLIRDEIVREKWEDEAAEVIGTITIVYDHHVSNVTEKLLRVQHHHLAAIASTTHVHMDEQNCLEVLILEGKAGQVRKLADEIISIKSVKHGKLTMTGKEF